MVYWPKDIFGVFNIRRLSLLMSLISSETFWRIFLFRFFTSLSPVFPTYGIFRVKVGNSLTSSADSLPDSIQDPTAPAQYLCSVAILLIGEFLFTLEDLPVPIQDPLDPAQELGSSTALLVGELLFTLEDLPVPMQDPLDPAQELGSSAAPLVGEFFFTQSSAKPLRSFF